MKTYKIKIDGKEYEILGCPFCGGGYVEFKKNTLTMSLPSTNIEPFSGPSFYEFVHYCTDFMRVFRMAETPEEIIEQWNKRAS